ncbi:MAG: MGMT family protein [Ruminococcaceae bacterium]|nr:MGMT family protein [Oscillospiraceae bacterium]
METNTFKTIYAIVRSIPCGKVSTYGRVALLAGNPRLARVVGYALHEAPQDVPCHRVVNRFGGLSAAFFPDGKDTHRMLLTMEGVGFTEDGCADLTHFMWYGPEGD